MSGIFESIAGVLAVICLVAAVLTFWMFALSIILWFNGFGRPKLQDYLFLICSVILFTFGTAGLWAYVNNFWEVWYNV